MKQIILVISILLSLTACGKNKSNFGQFGQYAFQYQHEANKRNAKIDFDSLEIRFFNNSDAARFKQTGDTISSNTLAVCVLGGYNGFEKSILVVPNQWNSLLWTDAYREVIMYHELGHCVRDMDHDNSEEAIMNPCLSTENSSAQGCYSGRVFGVQDYASNPTYYLDRHFR